MACRLIGAKPLSEPQYVGILLIGPLRSNLKFNRNSNIFIQENAFESDVCETAAILSRPQCVRAGRAHGDSLSIWPWVTRHHCDVIMDAWASQITSLTIVYSTAHSGPDQRKQQSSASLAFVRGIHQWLVNSPYKWPVTRKMFPFDDVIMLGYLQSVMQTITVPVIQPKQWFQLNFNSVQMYIKWYMGLANCSCSHECYFAVN